MIEAVFNWLFGPQIIERTMPAGHKVWSQHMGFGNWRHWTTAKEILKTETAQRQIAGIKKVRNA